MDLAAELERALAGVLASGAAEVHENGEWLAALDGLQYNVRAQGDAALLHFWGSQQSLVRRERLAAIRGHVHALPERQRLAVIMHKYQDMDYRQIAEVLQLSESATKSLLFRAYETLREKLKDFI